MYQLFFFILFEFQFLRWGIILCVNILEGKLKPLYVLNNSDKEKHKRWNLITISIVIWNLILYMNKKKKFPLLPLFILRSFKYFFLILLFTHVSKEVMKAGWKKAGCLKFESVNVAV